MADISDLGVGTELVYHKGTTVPTNSSGASGTTLIQSIDTDKKLITFDKLVAFEDGETMGYVDEEEMYQDLGKRQEMK